MNRKIKFYDSHLHLNTSNKFSYRLYSPIFVSTIGDKTEISSTWKDQIESGVNGLIVPLSEEAIADGIIELVKNQELRNTFISNLKKQNYGTESEIEKLYQIIDN